MVVARRHRSRGLHKNQQKLLSPRPNAINKANHLSVDLVCHVSKEQNTATQGKQFTWFGLMVNICRFWGAGLSLLVLGCWFESSGFRVMPLVLG